jgi:hypothetical protein
LAPAAALRTKAKINIREEDKHASGEDVGNQRGNEIPVTEGIRVIRHPPTCTDAAAIDMIVERLGKAIDRATVQTE